MAMIDCPECSSHISDKAPACPHCGNPLRLAVAPEIAVATKPGGVVTTEATGKYYKAMQLCGVLCILGGVASCSMREYGPGVSASLWMLGVILYFSGRIGGWWHHG